MEKPTASVTKSFTRKVNLGNYESVDIFESRSHSWFDSHPSKEEMDEKGKELFEQCKEAVELQVSDYIIDPEK